MANGGSPDGCVDSVWGRTVRVEHIGDAAYAQPRLFDDADLEQPVQGEMFE